MERGNADSKPPAPRFPGLVPGILMGMMVQVVALAIGAWGPLDGSFMGPDSNMRLHRVLECWGGTACSDGLIARSNWPFGETLHWPWIGDWLLLLGSMPLRSVLGQAEAVVASAYMFGPALECLTIAVFIFAVRSYIPAAALPFAGILFGAQLYVAWAFAYSRPDHHGLQTLLFTLGVLGFTGAVQSRSGGWAFSTGAAFGLAVWVSAEGLITTLPLLTFLGALWIVRGGVASAVLNRRVSEGALGVVGVALLLDGPQAGLLSVEFDRLSVVHVALFGALALFWSLVSRLEATRGVERAAVRSAAAVAGAVASLGLLSWLFPGFYRGPTADFPDWLWSLWLVNTAEYVPLIRMRHWLEILMSAAPFLISFPAAVLAMRTSRDSARVLWGCIAVMLLWFQGLATFQQVRWSYYVHALSPFAMAWLLGHILVWVGGRLRSLSLAAARVGLVGFFAIGPSVVATLVVLVGGPGAQPVGETECEAAHLVAELDALAQGGGPSDTAILAPLFWGPEILYRTSNAVIATPYHRNIEGIRSSHEVMSGDPDRAHTLISDRGVGAIAICNDRDWVPWVSVSDGQSFYGQLVEGNAPGWLRPIPTADSVPALRLYRVIGASPE